jgi:hypothetical protein
VHDYLFGLRPPQELVLLGVLLTVPLYQIGMMLNGGVTMARLVYRPVHWVVRYAQARDALVLPVIYEDGDQHGGLHHYRAKS